MSGIVELHLKPGLLARHGLPDLAYPVPVSRLLDAIDEDGVLPFAELLCGLQQRSSAVGRGDWRALEPALERLATLLTPEDSREVVEAAGYEDDDEGDWWLEVGPVDLARASLVTVQRDGELLAALTRRDDGRLRVAGFRPLDARSAQLLVELAQSPGPDGQVCMRRDNWEHALDCAAGIGQAYAAERGEAYLAWWERGLGMPAGGRQRPAWGPFQHLAPRRAAAVATEIGVQYALGALR